MRRPERRDAALRVWTSPRDFPRNTGAFGTGFISKRVWLCRNERTQLSQLTAFCGLIQAGCGCYTCHVLAGRWRANEKPAIEWPPSLSKIADTLLSARWSICAMAGIYPGSPFRARSDDFRMGAFHRCCRPHRLPAEGARSEQARPWTGEKWRLIETILRGEPCHTLFTRLLLPYVIVSRA